MAIETTEQATEYIKKVKGHLKELTELSQESGLNTHSAIWLAIAGGFCGGHEDVKEIVDMFGIYLKHKTMGIFE